MSTENHLPLASATGPFPEDLRRGRSGSSATRRPPRPEKSNILVTAEGEPKLLDFGIAKLLEENPLVLTATGQQRLTPISASPEQARGDEVTTASDIYALGALLYEMLTGQYASSVSHPPPGLDEVSRVVCEEEPLLPSLAATDPETRHALRGDLDAIMHRAMRKDPGASLCLSRGLGDGYSALPRGRAGARAA